MSYKIFSLDETALTIDFGGAVSFAVNDRICALAEFIAQNPFRGLREIVPAFNSLTIFYDVREVRRAFPKFETAFAAVKNHVEQCVTEIADFGADKPKRLVEIPVCYDAEFAPDLNFVAAHNNIVPEEVIKIHTSRAYRVFMLGFLPGFPYLGEIDERIGAPRKAEPRLNVPQGSVGIAGRQTGIYSLASPGGWQIIGKTPLTLFTPEAESPTLLQIGDTVQFYRINKSSFDELASNQSEIE